MSIVDFIEPKAPDPQALIQALEPAIAENRHANFGPVSQILEARLWALNGAASGRVAVATANGTLALQAAVCAFETALERRLRWVVSDFSFFSAFLGPFKGAQPVACGPDGMIDMGALESRDPASYDALLVTNVFGLCEDFDPVFAFARDHGKALLIDNAAGFRALAPYHTHSNAPLWAETISLHHTKPWGMGEGGAVFLSADLAPFARAAINFGAGLGHALPDTRLCTNGKMSEIAAAQCLTRVDTHRAWTPAYRMQAKRLLSLGLRLGLHPLFPDLPNRAVPGQVALLAERPIPRETLANPAFRIEKYYRPGPTSGPVAQDLYARVLNLPCHGGMAALSDAVIESTLRTIMTEARVAA